MKQNDRIDFYSYVAPFLLDSDDSSLNAEELKEAEDFMKDIKKFYGLDARIVDCDDEPRFGIPTWGGLKGEIMTYTIEYEFNQLPAEYWAV